MSNPPMRFKGHALHHNPENLKISEAKEVKEFTVPYNFNTIQNLGQKARVVTGDGVLYGNKFLEQYKELVELYSSPNSGALSLPGFSPFMASFTSLTVTSQPQDNFLKYKFTFVEDVEAANQINDTSKNTYNPQTETLWDISYKLGIPVEKLIKLNPGIKRPDIDLTGEKVVIK